MTEKIEANKLSAAYRALAVAFGLVIGLFVMVVALWNRPTAGTSGPTFRGPGAQENLVQQLYPSVRFTNIYPNMTSAEIDRLQRECSAIRYAYEPFVQFLPRLMSATYVNIDEPGIRRNATRAPWPPDRTALNILVFGGSTTLGY
ncbi:MAG: hypothetical protein ACPGVU_00490 [Limisphaerales bacterium]